MKTDVSAPQAAKSLRKSVTRRARCSPGAAIRAGSGITYTLVLLITSGCGQNSISADQQQLCSADWFSAVESAVSTGDGQGHGPDVGSEEWQSVVEFKLGVRGSSALPNRNSSEWCSYIDGLVSGKGS